MWEHFLNSFIKVLYSKTQTMTKLRLVFIYVLLISQKIERPYLCPKNASSQNIQFCLKRLLRLHRSSWKTKKLNFCILSHLCFGFQDWSWKQPKVQRLFWKPKTIFPINVTLYIFWLVKSSIKNQTSWWINYSFWCKVSEIKQGHIDTWSTYTYKTWGISCNWLWVVVEVICIAVKPDKPLYN